MGSQPPVLSPDWKQNISSLLQATDKNIQSVRGQGQPPCRGLGLVLSRPYTDSVQAARTELGGLLAAVQGSLAELRVETAQARHLSRLASGGYSTASLAHAASKSYGSPVLDSPDAAATPEFMRHQFGQSGVAAQHSPRIPALAGYAVSTGASGRADALQPPQPRLEQSAARHGADLREVWSVLERLDSRLGAVERSQEQPDSSQDSSRQVMEMQAAISQLQSDHKDHVDSSSQHRCDDHQRVSALVDRLAQQEEQSRAVREAAANHQQKHATAADESAKAAAALEAQVQRQQQQLLSLAEQMGQLEAQFAARRQQEQDVLSQLESHQAVTLRCNAQQDLLLASLSQQVADLQAKAAATAAQQATAAGVNAPGSGSSPDGQPHSPGASRQVDMLAAKVSQLEGRMAQARSPADSQARIGQEQALPGRVATLELIMAQVGSPAPADTEASNEQMLALSARLAELELILRLVQSQQGDQPNAEQLLALTNQTAQLEAQMAVLRSHDAANLSQLGATVGKIQLVGEQLRSQTVETMRPMQQRLDGLTASVADLERQQTEAVRPTQQRLDSLEASLAALQAAQHSTQASALHSAAQQAASRDLDSCVTGLEREVIKLKEAAAQSGAASADVADLPAAVQRLAEDVALLQGQSSTTESAGFAHLHQRMQKLEGTVDELSPLASHLADAPVVRQLQQRIGGLEAALAVQQAAAQHATSPPAAAAADPAAIAKLELQVAELAAVVMQQQRDQAKDPLVTTNSKILDLQHQLDTLAATLQQQAASHEAAKAAEREHTAKMERRLSSGVDRLESEGVRMEDLNPMLRRIASVEENMGRLLSLSDQQALQAQKLQDLADSLQRTAEGSAKRMEQLSLWSEQLEGEVAVCHEGLAHLQGNLPTTTQSPARQAAASPDDLVKSGSEQPMGALPGGVAASDAEAHADSGSAHGSYLQRLQAQQGTSGAALRSPRTPCAVLRGQQDGAAAGSVHEFGSPVIDMLASRVDTLSAQNAQLASEVQKLGSVEAQVNTLQTSIQLCLSRLRDSPMAQQQQQRQQQEGLPSPSGDAASPWGHQHVPWGGSGPASPSTAKTSSTAAEGPAEPAEAAGQQLDESQIDASTSAAAAATPSVGDNRDPDTDAQPLHMRMNSGAFGASGPSHAYGKRREVETESQPLQWRCNSGASNGSVDFGVLEERLFRMERHVASQSSLGPNSQVIGKLEERLDELDVTVRRMDGRLASLHSPRKGSLPATPRAHAEPASPPDPAGPQAATSPSQDGAVDEIREQLFELRVELQNHLGDTDINVASIKRKAELAEQLAEEAKEAVEQLQLSLEALQAASPSAPAAAPDAGAMDGAGSQARPDQAAALEGPSTAGVNQLSELQEQMAGFNTHVEEIQARLDDLGDQIQGALAGLAISADTQQRLQDVEDRLLGLSGELGSASDTLAAVQQAAAAAATGTGGHDTRIAHIAEEVQQMQTTQLDVLAQDVRKLFSQTAQVDTLAQDVGKLHSQLSDSARQAQLATSTAEALASVQSQLDSLRSQMQALQQQQTLTAPSVSSASVSSELVSVQEQLHRLQQQQQEWSAAQPAASASMVSELASVQQQLQSFAEQVHRLQQQQQELTGAQPTASGSISSELASVKDQLQAVDGQLQTLQQQQAAAVAQLASNERSRQSAFDTVTSKLEAMHTEVDVLRAALVAVEHTAAHAEGITDSTASMLDQQRHELSALKQAEDARQVELSALKAQVAAVHSYQAEIKALQESSSALSQQHREITILKASLAALNGHPAEIQALKDGLTVLAQQQIALSQQAGNFAALKSSIAALEQQQAAATALEPVLDGLQSQVSTLTTRSAVVDEHSALLSALKAGLEQHQDSIGALKTGLVALDRDNGSTAQAVGALRDGLGTFDALKMEHRVRKVEVTVAGALEEVAAQMSALKAQADTAARESQQAVAQLSQLAMPLQTAQAHAAANMQQLPNPPVAAGERGQVGQAASESQQARQLSTAPVARGGGQGSATSQAFPSSPRARVPPGRDAPGASRQPEPPAGPRTGAAAGTHGSAGVRLFDNDAFGTGRAALTPPPPQAEGSSGSSSAAASAHFENQLFTDDDSSDAEDGAPPGHWARPQQPGGGGPRIDHQLPEAEGAGAFGQQPAHAEPQRSGAEHASASAAPAAVRWAANPMAGASVGDSHDSPANSARQQGSATATTSAGMTAGSIGLADPFASQKHAGAGASQQPRSQQQPANLQPSIRHPGMQQQQASALPPGGAQHSRGNTPRGRLGIEASQDSMFSDGEEQLTHRIRIIEEQLAAADLGDFEREIMQSELERLQDER